MRYQFLSDEWFTQLDALIAAAGDLQIPPAMKAAVVNVTVTTPGGDRQLAIKDGVLARGHLAAAPTTVKLSVELARKIFVEADAAAGVQAFLAGEMQVEGDLKTLVEMQTVEPSAAQQRLAKQLAAITE